MPSPERVRPQDFADLKIRIFPNEAAGYPVEITLGGQREFKRGYVSSAILPWVSSGAPAEDGQKLFDVFLADQVLRDAWNTSREAAPQRRVRLRIDADAAELHALPWELLQRGPAMLLAQTDTPFSP